ncbi:MAG: hypothetical protein WCH43_08395 [Verrucomicrobiota bacterium]
MKFRVLLILALAFSFASCDSFNKNKKKKPKPPKSIKDPSGDVTFEGFLNRLRKAAEKHDVQMLASMMTPDFGYLMDPTSSDPGSGEGVWKYWEAHNLWPEVTLVLHEKFVPFGNFMVSPSQFVTDPAYTGYRAGIVNWNGSWRFAYFVSGNQAQETPPPQ